jgi:hypothetical protein
VSLLLQSPGALPERFTDPHCSGLMAR